MLAFDSKTETVTVWNPWGNTFTPTGEPGFDHGYPTAHGRFTMPLRDFARTFRAVIYETDQPL